MSVSTVGIIGAGQMGAGVAQVAAQATKELESESSNGAAPNNPAPPPNGSPNPNNENANE